MARLGPEFNVRAGDPLQAGPWNTVGKFLRSLRLISGFGVRLRDNPDGTIINFDGGGEVFNHPFRVTLQGNEAAIIQPGRINGVSAKIKGILLEGDDSHPAPTLNFPSVRLDKEKKGWIAAEVTCSDKDWSIQKVEIVQVADLDSDDGNPPKEGTASLSSTGGVPNLPGRRARAALAMLRMRSGGNLVAFQCTMHDLQHRRRANTQEASLDAGRHFFYPAG